jgi:hypothetical protein
MNRSPDVDLVLRDYFAEDGLTAPDYVLDVIEGRIARQSQRPAWRLLRSQPMNPFLKLAAAAAAMVAVVTVGLNLLDGRMPNGGTPTVAPSPPATPTITPTAAATQVAFACSDPEFGCEGVLSPGTHTTTTFRPVLSFTTETGWVNTMDRDRAYTLHNLEWPAHFFQIYSQVAIPEQNATCSAERKPGAGSAVADWVEFYSSHPGLDTTEPVSFTLGEQSGVQLDLHVASDWTATCPNSIAPAVFLITNDADVPDRVKWIDDQRVAVWIVDVRGTTVIVYLESGPSDVAMAELKGLFEPFVETFRFPSAS